MFKYKAHNGWSAGRYDQAVFENLHSVASTCVRSSAGQTSQNECAGTFYQHAHLRARCALDSNLGSWRWHNKNSPPGTEMIIIYINASLML